MPPPSSILSDLPALHIGLEAIMNSLEISIYEFFEFFILHWMESPDLIGSANPYSTQVF